MNIFLWSLVSVCYGLLSNKLHEDAVWNLRNKNGSVQVKNISVLNTHMALMEGGVLQGDPYFRDNELVWSWVAKDDWTYTSTWKTKADVLAHSAIALRCQIDTVAIIKVNGILVGKTDSMHQVYEFDLSDVLRPADSDNYIEVTIRSALHYAQEEASKYPYPVPESVYYHVWSEGDQPDDSGWGNGTYSHRNFIRKSSSDFGWDWGPSFVPSGITSFEILSRNTASLEGVTVQQRHGSDGVHLTVNALVGVVAENVNARLQVTLTHSETGKLESASTVHLLQQGQQEVPLELHVEEPRLWWPVGYGDPALYDLRLELLAREEQSNISRQIGLRTVELVTEPLPNGESFYFRVNGVAVYAKGSNFIPTDVFQPRAEAELDWILQSAVDANMNMVRVWGGGMYQVDSFYDLADQKGLMIWQEMMFGCALYPRDPKFLRSIRTELTQQVTRLQHHASIVIWGGNNENEGALTWYAASRANRDLYVVDYNALYIDTARAALLSVDADVAFIDSSPSNGLVASKPFTKRWGDVQNPNYGDVHYYDYDVDCEDHTTYPKARFISEHGYQSFPAFEEYKQVLVEEDWSHNSSVLFYRQRHPDGQAQMLSMLHRHFRVPPEIDAENQKKVFDDYLYLTQVQQSKCYETAFAQWRRLRSDTSVNTMGILYWQLNDIWQGPSWSSMERSGRWRLTHNAVRRAFEPVLLSMVQEAGRVTAFVTSDLATNVTTSVTVSLQRFQGGPSQWSKSCKVTVSAASASCTSFDLETALNDSGCSKEECFLLARSEGERRLEAHLFLTPLKDAELPEVQHTISNLTVSGNRATFMVSTDNVAIYSALESPIVGRFTPNGMHLMPGQETMIEFLARSNIGTAAFAKSLRFRSLRDTYDQKDAKQVQMV
jgi:beta-mannosidase